MSPIWVGVVEGVGEVILSQHKLPQPKMWIVHFRLIWRFKKQQQIMLPVIPNDGEDGGGGGGVGVPNFWPIPKVYQCMQYMQCMQF